MATIIVEDGSEVAGANSYVSEADLSTYASDRGITLTSTTSVLIIQAMDYIESQNYKGLQSSSTQPLQWPRTEAWIDSYPIDFDAIPQLLIDALCETCIAIDGGNNPLANQGRATKREKVDVIEVEYMDGARDITYLAAVENKLTKLLDKSGGSINAIVVRA